MSAAWVYPPLPPTELKKAEDTSLANELSWLLESLQSTLASLKDGLEECLALLAPEEPGSTLVLSSLRSESVKGFVTRVGTKIVKGEIHLRLPTLPPPKGQATYKLSLSTQPTAPDLVLRQLQLVRSLMNQSLDVVDVSTWTGDAHNANFIAGQLKLLHDFLMEARGVIKGEGLGEAGAVEKDGGGWWCDSAEGEVFDPALPPDLSFHLSISDASLVLHIRTLQPTNPDPHTPTPSSAPELSLSGFNLRDRLFGLGPKLPQHDETGQLFRWRGVGGGGPGAPGNGMGGSGGKEVRVREKVRVESADPGLIALAAKLSALSHEVGRCRVNLGVLMGEDPDVGEE